ncbi:PTS sugar transporter subunit IIA [Pedosphaera parvula]|uniref:Putative PTS IIA-like nitrogen-regulatory protein PtsN n=1 Tax=Pedosphaera parvula (strain Ellin514) TaxID=320771 RepID=B9XR60_PEDPL|nr:PTS sugar transporter subunit IIA [Pedosphaera parvula]EEF57673.1 putative PTS IIA-like nitrogen-regulatory protein PtsN [Pedosphaera parvula Ellin514]
MRHSFLDKVTGPTLADFTSEGLIVPDLKARDMAGVILELSNAFQKHDPVWNAQRLNQAALGREEQMSTAMNFLTAFPHVRSKDCPKMQFALGRASEPMEWGRPGSLKVQFVFLNAIPATEALGYLKLLSGASKLGKEAALLEQFKAAATARELYQLLQKITIRKHAHSVTG